LSGASGNRTGRRAWLIGLKRARPFPPRCLKVRLVAEHALADTVATLPDHRIASRDIEDVDAIDRLPMTKRGCACYLVKLSKIPSKPEILMDRRKTPLWRQA